MSISREEFKKTMIDRLEPEVHDALVFLRNHPDQAFTVRELESAGVLLHEKLLDFYKYVLHALDVVDCSTIRGEMYFIIIGKGEA